MRAEPLTPSRSENAFVSDAPAFAKTRRAWFVTELICDDLRSAGVRGMDKGSPRELAVMNAMNTRILAALS